MVMIVSSLLATAALVLSAIPAPGQLEPSGTVLIQNAPGEYYFFRSEGVYPIPAIFIYLNYCTGVLDWGEPTVAADGSFFALSILGFDVSGQISPSSISVSYNNVTVSSSTLSPYRRLHNW